VLEDVGVVSQTLKTFLEKHLKGSVVLGVVIHITMDA
jgi:hypothetical protein